MVVVEILAVAAGLTLLPLALRKLLSKAGPSEDDRTTVCRSKCGLGSITIGRRKTPTWSPQRRGSVRSTTPQLPMEQESPPLHVRGSPSAMHSVNSVRTHYESASGSRTILRNSSVLTGRRRSVWGEPPPLPQLVRSNTEALNLMTDNLQMTPEHSIASRRSNRSLMEEVDEDERVRMPNTRKLREARETWCRRVFLLVSLLVGLFNFLGSVESVLGSLVTVLHWLSGRWNV